jgi:hypothetical protein
MFDWPASMNVVFNVAQPYDRRIPLDPSLTVPIVARLVEVCAAAIEENLIESGAHERKKAQTCMIFNFSPIVRAVWFFSADHGAAALSHFAKQAATPEAVDYLLNSVSLLRKAAAAPDVPLRLSLYASRLAAAVCGLCGFCQLAQPGDRAGELDMLITAPFIACLEEGTSAWTDLVRQSVGAPDFDFFHSVSNVWTIDLFFYVYRNFIPGAFHGVGGGDLWLSQIRSRIQPNAEVCSLATRGVRCVTEIAATLPVAISMWEPGNVAELAKGKPKKPANRELYTTGHLQGSALGYANIIAASWVPSGTEDGVSATEELAEAGHGCRAPR